MQTVIKKLIEQQNLTSAEMIAAMETIMHGKATPAQIGGFLVALRLKGETVEEIAAAAKVIRALALPVKISGEHLVDIVGTGGDQAQLFNISTVSAFVAAAAGAKVAKHNNRAVSGASGSADLLEIAGINARLEPEQIEQCINQIGIGFMFAPSHHLSWKYVMPARRELGIRTVFNLLGPLVNPARVPNLLIGVFDKKWVESFAKVAKELGDKHVLIVHSEDGLDEISIAVPTFVAELKNGEIKTYTIEPQQFGIKKSSLDALKIKNSAESFSIIKNVLDNKAGAARDMVALNAGAAIYTAGLAKTIEAGVKKALEVIASGAAKEKFHELVKLTQSFK